MANIRPSSDLRNKYNEISDFCNKYNEPVFITKNGRGDLVVISNAEYERLRGLLELHSMLDKGAEASHPGSGRPAKEVLDEIGRKYGFEQL